MTSNPDDAAADPTAAGPDPATAAVLHDLATSIALLPQAPPPEGAEQLEGAIALPVIEQDGQRYIPVFTSEDALRSAGADPGTALRIPIAQLAANWPSDDMWLAVNPASEEGLGLPPDVVRALPVFAAGPDGAGRVPPG
ncbi:SseB family protein [Pseudonocardia sp. K10HN5]|uniref:SseB family protein n=1 Tax=Pseudonocardia acidicola TaxID=2724939 RepID=A0ABX1S5V1_9PSEU|nr:SseB family protein [Pseudonocardia acidicola]